jgi:hypothetical protein
MTFTASRYRKRSVAVAMLFVFALLSGVANACLTEPRGEPLHAGSHAAEADHHALPALRSPAAEPTGHDQRASCQKSCGEASQTLLKQQSKLDKPDALGVVGSVGGWTSEPYRARAVLARAALVAVLPPLPPPRVQFSRLAL